MRSTTRNSIRALSAVGAVALTSGTWFSTAHAAPLAPNDGQSSSPSASAPASVAPSATTEPSSTAAPSATATSKPTASPSAHTPGTVTRTVWWMLPEGADATRAWTYTQVRIAAGELPCGRIAQVDTYTGTQEQIDALGETLTPGEDAEVYVDSTIKIAEQCAPRPSETPTATTGPSAPVTNPGETPTAPSSSPATAPAGPSSQPTPPTPPRPNPSIPNPSGSNPSGPATTPGDSVSTPGDEGPADSRTPGTPPMPQTDGTRPTSLPHTGDQSDGFSPLAAGAGLCGVVFASTFLVRRHRKN